MGKSKDQSLNARLDELFNSLPDDLKNKFKDDFLGRHKEDMNHGRDIVGGHLHNIETAFSVLKAPNSLLWMQFWEMLTIAVLTKMMLSGGITSSEAKAVFEGKLNGLIAMIDELRNDPIFKNKAES